MIITEFMENGSLDTFLRANDGKFQVRTFSVYIHKKKFQIGLLGIHIFNLFHGFEWHYMAGYKSVMC